MWLEKKKVERIKSLKSLAPGKGHSFLLEHSPQQCNTPLALSQFSRY